MTWACERPAGMLTCERAYYAMVENLLEASSSSSSSSSNSHLFGVSTQRRLLPDPDPRLSFINCMILVDIKYPGVSLKKRHQNS